MAIAAREKNFHVKKKAPRGIGQTVDHPTTISAVPADRDAQAQEGQGDLIRRACILRKTDCRAPHAARVVRSPTPGGSLCQKSASCPCVISPFCAPARCPVAAPQVDVFGVAPGAQLITPAGTIPLAANSFALVTTASTQQLLPCNFAKNTGHIILHVQGAC